MTRRGSQRRRTAAVGAFSVAAHVCALALLLTLQGTPPKVEEPAPMVVQLAEAPQADPVAAPTPDPPPPAKPPPPRSIARQVRAPPPDARPLPSGKPSPSADGDDEASDAQVASAATAGSGAGGRCDMVRQLQAALRRNSLVQAAVAEARSESGRAMFVWNGDWIRSHGQDGAGLAAVREAIMWEIAFAPEACRAQPVHGLVLLSLNDGPGGGRLVMGEGDWRWSDMLKRH
ncbi:hypothetical protein [Phenylobacterium sp.]|uniref:hypothetical protein n=1 Tax=Phenylobacterium sp. TaxID=1871053 RepID=UPI002CD2603F|nr:hypothetical protein [Phenylobacterium sp.]HLZ77511.1 hypothetical protein [Phenylobacterium sp.]